jgi:hypothetical protein
VAQLLVVRHHYVVNTQKTYFERHSFGYAAFERHGAFVLVLFAHPQKYIRHLFQFLVWHHFFGFGSFLRLSIVGPPREILGFQLDSLGFELRAVNLALVNPQPATFWTVITMMPNTALEPTSVTPASFRCGFPAGGSYRRRGSVFGR